MKADGTGQLRWTSIFKLDVTWKCHPVRFADAWRAEKNLTQPR
jgi:hypothetical protein